MLALTLAACEPQDPALLDPVARAVRASIVLRGFPPTPGEVLAVRDDPSRLPGLVDRWLLDPAFGSTIRDVHADQLLLRADIIEHLDLPQRDVLEGLTDAIVFPAE